MPTASQHKRKIEHNQNFVDFIRKQQPDFCDWMVVGLFYIAIHQIERYLASKGANGLHYRTHVDRENAMARVSDFRPLWGDYRLLKDMSEDARYEVVPITEADVATAEASLGNIEIQIDSLCP